MEPQTFRLPEHLDLTAAAPLRAHLAALVGGSLNLDASSVQRLGGLCFQVVLAAGIAWRIQGHDLRVVNPSEAFMDNMKLLGIDDFNAWMEERQAA